MILIFEFKNKEKRHPDGCLFCLPRFCFPPFCPMHCMLFPGFPRKNGLFARAYHYATQRAHQLNVYWDFQHAWGIERLLQGKTITSLPKHSRERDFDFLNPRYIAGRMQFLDDFKTSICKLLPEAVSWSYKQWMDYNHVCKAFQLKYDIDLSSSSDQLNSVYHLMKYNVDNHFYLDFDDILNAPLNYAIYMEISE